MFIGHYGPAFALKGAARPIPLWALFLGVQWLDVGWALLVLAGIEKLRIVPGFTAGSPLDLYYMPYTHGLPGALALSVLFGLIVAGWLGAPRGRLFLAAAAAAFSHWVLDLVVHVPDLPLYDNHAKVGLGLWRHVGVSASLEIGLLVWGAWLYARNVQALLDYITKDGALALDPDDEIVAGATITRDGEIVHEATRAALTGGPA